jgi:hypothetical protein
MISSLAESYAQAGSMLSESEIVRYVYVSGFLTGIEAAEAGMLPSRSAAQSGSRIMGLF